MAKGIIPKKKIKTRGMSIMAKNPKGLYANIHAKKRENRMHGSGEKMRRPGAKGAPTKKAFVNSAKTAKKKPKKKTSVVNKLKKNKIKKVSKALVKASKLHAGQAKVLKKIIKKK